MKKTFKRSLKGGLYFPLALLAGSIPAAQVSALQTDDKPVESEQAASEENAEPKADDKAMEDTDSEQTETEQTKSVKEQIAQLTVELRAKSKELNAAYKAAKTTAEKREIIQSSPGPAYAEKFLTIYEANPGDKDAFPALLQALFAGGRRNAAKPTKILVELSNDQDSEIAQKSCKILMQYGTPQAKTTAANKLLELGNQAAEDAEARRADAIQLLLPIANTPLRGQTALQEEAVESLWALAKTNPESTDIAALAAVGFNADSEASSAAFNAIMEHHIDDKAIESVLASVPREITPAYETIIQEVIKNGKGDAQVQAAISLAKYIPIRDGKLDRLALNEEELEENYWEVSMAIRSYTKKPKTNSSRLRISHLAPKRWKSLAPTLKVKSLS